MSYADQMPHGAMSALITPFEKRQDRYEVLHLTHKAANPLWNGRVRACGHHRRVCHALAQ